MPEHGGAARAKFFYGMNLITDMGISAPTEQRFVASLKRLAQPV